MSSSKIIHRASKTVHEGVPPEAVSSNLDFYWTKHAEPHVLRRKQIIKKHPEVTKLCGHEPMTKYICIFVVLLQMVTAYSLRNTSFWSLKFWGLAYVIGATANQNCFLAIHELCHNLGFKKPINNRLFSIVVNLPIGIPYSASFQPYHQLHHKFLGDELFDTDLPTYYEAVFFSNVLGKAFFATFQIFFYALRPMFITQIQFTIIHLLNVLVQLTFDIIVVSLFGWNFLLYLLLSSFLAGSLHPCAGHFVAEHYIFNPPESYINYKDVPPLETYSYYGILNMLTWNVGYHNEHHDFPFVAWSKLPQLRKLAREFYDPLPRHESWCKVTWDFIFDENVLLYNRIKRPNLDVTQKKKVDFNDNSY
ncbi:hypothetical protein PACTADRAFT_33414 [Pachysolen tannophilus NRRL Y-2460]|uniref:Sphingolipid delta(4)-desaturase n=1 Tax=Pachysolen tannophilus NRRL Y-2460 TaxID=669874 RepID=A0A1E4TWX3_PACTA|nr:hypothetical protein PACTADRAFT_33414 [Pachysolen tannophilus NRRL Y-2460]